jgi:hypothetical protein
MKARKARTAEQVLREQEAQANAARENAVVRAGSTALAADNLNTWIEIGAELDKVLGLTRMKFSHTAGEYTVGEAETIPLGTRGVAHADKVEWGYKLYKDGQFVDQQWGRMADGFAPPPENKLPDNELRQQPDGSQKRPWQFSMVLPVTLLNAGDQTYALRVTSKGGIRAVGTVSREYAKRLRKGPPGLPVVELREGKYWHSVHNCWVHYPVLLIVNWTGPDGKPLSTSDDLEDAIPEFGKKVA